MNRFNEYRITWVMVLFDLPTETKKEKKAYSCFRKALLKGGFTMFQFSIYLRHCPSIESAETHIYYVQHHLPQKGHVGIVTLTDRQFGQMEILTCRQPVSLQIPVQQLELF